MFETSQDHRRKQVDEAVQPFFTPNANPPMNPAEKGRPPRDEAKKFAMFVADVDATLMNLS